jgi:hypothetical protein
MKERQKVKQLINRKWSSKNIVFNITCMSFIDRNARKYNSWSNRNGPAKILSSLYRAHISYMKERKKERKYNSWSDENGAAKRLSSLYRAHISYMKERKKERKYNSWSNENEPAKTLSHYRAYIVYEGKKESIIASRMKMNQQKYFLNFMLLSIDTKECK